MAAPILSLKDIRLTFGGTPLLTGAELIVGARERIALVGRNGSGKSSLLKVAAGLLVPDAGEVFVQPGLLVRYLAQEPDLSAYRRVDDYVQDGLGPMGDPQRARQMVEKLGLKGDQVLTSMSGGELRRVAIVRAMAANPDVLLMDEPTNHLDIAAIEWLEGELGRSRAALVLISHDRRFLENLSRSTVWLDRGVTRRIEKGFSGFEAYRDEVLEAEELAQHKLDRKIAAEEHWVRYGVTARRKRNMGRMARLQGLREERREWRGPPGAAVLEASEAQASGKLLVEAKHLDLSFGDRAIVRDFSFRIRAGDRVGIAGPNGTGKTSLVRLLTGDLSPDGGSVKIGATSALQVLAQNRDSLDPEKSLKDTLTGGGSDKIEINGSSRHVVSYMKDFLFTPEQAGTPVGRLSGGERARVALARALALPSNFLVLDEPTNDLDLETLDLLQEMLADYSGTLILVSHDRDFLDRVATLMLAPEGEGRWVEYAGGYSDMQAQRKPGSLPLKERRVASSRAESSRPESLHNVASAQTQKKLSFKQQHALKVLPGRIAELFAEMTAVQEALSNPDFYGRDPEGFAKKSKALEALGREHAGLEEEWLALEILQEQMSRSD